MVGVYESGMNTQLGKGVCEKLISAAIEGGGGNDFIAGSCNVQDGIGNGRCAAGYCQTCGASFQGSQSFSSTSWVGLVRRP